jgi:hypothetical protein
MVKPWQVERSAKTGVVRRQPFDEGGEPPMSSPAGQGLQLQAAG